MRPIFWLLIFPPVLVASAGNCSLQTPHVLKCRTRLPILQNLNATLVDNVRVLELHDIEQDELDLNDTLFKLTEIKHLSMFGGNVSRIIWPKSNVKIKVLELVGVGVENIGYRFLGKFPNLESLNLQDNYLQTLNSNFSSTKINTLYLADNRWNCSMDLSWVFVLNETVKDLRHLTCFGEPHANKPLLTIAGFMKELKEQCPSNCNCSLPKVVLRTMGSQHLDPIIEVNCSHRGLTQLPLDLPQKTKIIHLEGNEIEDLTPLKHHPIYRKALDLYLDNNKIKTIDELEGSFWLKHFRVFSLSGNKLTEIPTYAIDNALEQNSHMPSALRISLGGNPWRCDCVFTPVFQEMLQKFAPQIRDMAEVKCSYVEGDENSLLPIIELSRSSVCRSPTEYSVQALDLLNGVLASLIVLILGKLAYDYYYFKKTGRLPWIVTKMP